MAPEPRRFLRDLFDAAVAAADPALCVPPHLPPRPPGRTVVVGAGKAAAAMARAVEGNWDGPLSGLVITRYGYGVPCRRIEVVEAAHPVPDAAGEAAARRILGLVADLGPDDLVLCLVSGGASALLAVPADGLALADKQAIARALLASGAAIREMNAVRKHLSAVKGGRLAAAAAPAQVVTLLISDVPGDDPAVIGSGPTIPDPSTLAEARAVVEKYRIALPDAAARLLADPAAETPKPGDAAFARAQATLVARPAAALAAAARLAVAHGFAVDLLGDAIEGEAREVGRAHAALAAAAAGPRVVLSGGECTVRLSGTGRGGPNTEYLLALAVALAGRPGVHALAADTDGIDGSEDNAGAFIAPDTLGRARARGLDPDAHLAANDAHGFFAGLGDLLVTGPTYTNVNDFRAILVLGEPGNSRAARPAAR